MAPFKMNPKSPMMKALVGKQGNLPQHLQDAIKAAPETPKKAAAKKYGTEPVKKDPEAKKRKLGTEGMTPDQKVAYYKKQSENMKKKKASSNKAPRGPQNISAGGVKARASVKGRSEKNTDLLEVAKGGYSKAKKYVKDTFGIKKTKDNSPVRKNGKTKLPSVAARDKKGNLKAKRGPQTGSIGGVRVSIQTKGRSTKNTDLLEVGKKVIKNLSSKGKGSGARARKRNNRKS